MVRPSAVQTVWGGKENRGRGTFGRGGSSATAHSSRKCPEPTDKVDTMKHFVNCSDSSQKVKIVMFFVKIVTISSKKSPNIESCLGSKPTHAQSQTHLILSLTHIHRVPSISHPEQAHQTTPTSPVRVRQATPHVTWTPPLPDARQARLGMLCTVLMSRKNMPADDTFWQPRPAPRAPLPLRLLHSCSSRVSHTCQRHVPRAPNKSRTRKTR